MLGALLAAIFGAVLLLAALYAVLRDAINRHAAEEDTLDRDIFD